MNCMLTLKEAIARMNLTQKEACTLLRWNQPRLNKYIHGECIIPDTAVGELERLLKCRVVIHKGQKLFSPCGKKAGAE